MCVVSLDTVLTVRIYGSNGLLSFLEWIFLQENITAYELQLAVPTLFSNFPKYLSKDIKYRLSRDKKLELIA